MARKKKKKKTAKKKTAAKKPLKKKAMRKTRGGHNETDLEFFKPAPTKPPLGSGSGS